MTPPTRAAVQVHRLLAKVYFTPESQTAPRTLRLSFQHCAPVLAPPRFTG